MELSGPHPRRLLAVPTPGHSKSHIAFFEELSQTLIAGDLVSTLGTVVINPPDGNMGEYMRSLERIRELGAKALLPGHGPPSRGVAHLIEALIEHRRQRESRVLRALEGGPMGRLPGAGGRWTPAMGLDWVPLQPDRVAEVAYEQVDGIRFRHPARFRRWRISQQRGYK